MSSVGGDSYTRAERYLPWNANKLIVNARVEPHWLNGSDSFWYRRQDGDVVTAVMVDPERNGIRPAFDRVRLANALSSASGHTVDPDRLELDNLQMTDEDSILLVVNGQAWACELPSYYCKEVVWNRTGPSESLSPDRNHAVYVRDGDLFVRSRASGEESRLTNDGEPGYAYGARPEGRGEAVADHILGRKRPPPAVWSPDGSKLVANRLDERRVQSMYLQQSEFESRAWRPVCHSFRAALVGDEHLPAETLFIFDLETGWTVKVDHKPQPLSYLTAIELQRVWWSHDARYLYFIYEERGCRSLSLIRADARTGETETLLTETADTTIAPGPTFLVRPSVRVLESAHEVLWYSCRDGWGHIYLYDAESGRLKRQVTEGPWVVHDILAVDERNRQIYVVAGGKERDRDPYFRHLYRVSLDRSDITLLTPEDAEHGVTFSPSGRFFVDTYSRVDLPPVSVLRSAEGAIIRKLAEADVSEMVNEGFRYPERFTVKARDGETDLHGVIVWPSNYDSAKRYPVLDSIYPGPQCIWTPKHFAGASHGPFGDDEWLWHEQALAELGFAVIRMDGQGTPFRSKAFQDVAYGDAFGEAGGLEDHVIGIRELGARYPCLDTERVGIFGHSGGGYASTRAILQFPDFYKVAVSSAGNHDQRGMTAFWGERYVGLPWESDYESQTNIRLAANLTGKLMLVWGELDEAVSPLLTLQLADVLVNANKDFDLLFLPCTGHRLVDLREGLEAYESPNAMIHPYFVRKRWDYFVQHLLGCLPPQGYEIAKDC